AMVIWTIVCISIVRGIICLISPTIIFWKPSVKVIIFISSPEVELTRTLKLAESLHASYTKKELPMIFKTGANNTSTTGQPGEKCYQPYCITSFNKLSKNQIHFFNKA